MKLNSIKRLVAASTALAITTCAYADFEITFDTATQDTEWSGSGITWSPGPAGWAGGGCLQATNQNGGWQGSGFMSVTFSYSSGHQPNLWAMNANQGHVSFDIIVNGASFPNQATGATVNDYWQIWVAGNSAAGGYIQQQVVSPPNYVPGDTNLYAYHVDLTFASLGWTSTNAANHDYYQINFWSNSQSTNPVNFYMDNLDVYTAATVSPTNYLSRVTGPKGLILMTSSNVFSYDVGQEQYQRQDIRTAVNSTSYNFHDNGPVTYSVTITNYPSVAHSNFQAQIWIVDGAATDNAPDYNEADCASFAIHNNNDGTGTGTFNYKVNSPAGYGTFFGTGNLGSVNGASVLGTWQVTLNQDSVTLTAPDGSTWVTNMVAGDSANFSGEPLEVYLDNQAISVQNIGQKGVYSSFQISSNGVALFSDNFSSPVLDTTKWSTGQAEDPNGVYQIPSDAVYAVQWTLPAGGFNLQTSPTIGGPWIEPGIRNAAVGGLQTTYIPSSFVATNPTSFFRLSNP